MVIKSAGLSRHVSTCKNEPGNQIEHEEIDSEHSDGKGQCHSLLKRTSSQVLGEIGVGEQQILAPIEPLQCLQNNITRKQGADGKPDSHRAASEGGRDHKGHGYVHDRRYTVKHIRFPQIEDHIPFNDLPFRIHADQR